jgi:hypothetical protein
MLKACLLILPFLFFANSSWAGECDVLNKISGGGWFDNGAGSCILNGGGEQVIVGRDKVDQWVDCNTKGMVGRVDPGGNFECLTKEKAWGITPQKSYCGKSDREKFNGSCGEGNSGTGVVSPDLALICPPFEEQVERCIDDTDEAESSTCNYKKNKDTSNFMSMADGIVKALGTTTGMNIQMACTKMKDISQLANGAMLAFKTSCLISQKNCSSSCTAAANMRRDDPRLAGCDARGAVNVALKKFNRTCNALTTTIDDAGAHLMTMYATQLNAQKCDELTTANLQAYCQSNPNDPMCGTTIADCSNPTTAASNTICICQTNPSDSRCGTTNSASNKISSGSDSSGSSAADGTAGGLNGLQGANLNLTGLEGDAGFDPSTAGTRGPSAGNQTGGKGTGRNIGGGDGPAAGSGKQQAGGGGGNGASTKVLGGYYGGGAGAFMGGGSSGSSGSGGSGYQSSGGSNGNQKMAVDLKQFLPGGKQDPSRSLAGISGPDGITGPNSDIWLKVNTRYRSVGPSMKP